MNAADNKDSGLKDYIDAFAVTITGADALAKQFEAKHDDYNAIMVKALADRLAEAFAAPARARAQGILGLRRMKHSTANISFVKSTRAYAPPPVTRPARTTPRRNCSSG